MLLVINEVNHHKKDLNQPIVFIVRYNQVCYNWVCYNRVRQNQVCYNRVRYNWVWYNQVCYNRVRHNRVCYNKVCHNRFIITEFIITAFDCIFLNCRCSRLKRTLHIILNAPCLKWAWNWHQLDFYEMWHLLFK